ncbi:NDP-sugar epimerase, includes UDP-GlcNAc-inverting 4,6-dehydratase FlaA1 and capsular polysaccharide biosynthesis protein EpsC [Cognatiyoonia sediminum]|uniref:NDP-sugar epimerase, includes UDP-GlcNAc-inverting 4,6-dehydratase FlaA1 and capsular polysaccharide biosynthesis protein EpsC n=2 Tax=Cognatiyoonia sediminum TaxID=1508389 RepID=A0A1M5QRZ3_9RHOB|nr:NDP-sugar epimerase, includes UDP-GlcNAc-inverting 4,6-dehydratase FlaA1 and capsular polysaccharide biosynthesis protein EpsC [Cognatiyoonia sediminum]
MATYAATVWVQNMFQYLASLPRGVKRAILLMIDCALVPISMYWAFSLRFGVQVETQQLQDSIPLFVLVLLASLPIFSLTKLNRIKLIAFEVQDIGRGVVAAMCLTVVAIVVSYLLRLDGPRSMPLIFGTVFLTLHILVRILARSLLMYISGRDSERVPVAIYGAGSAGVQLMAALRQDFEMRPVLFVDDNVTLQSMTIAGLPVYSAEKLAVMVRNKRVQRVLLAMPSATEGVRRQKIKELSKLDCEVYALPSYSELIGESGIVDKLQPVDADMLLARDKVDLDTPEIARTYAGRSILVTGAGGSIGSELCNQIIRCNPHRLVLFEHSEFALYSIERELAATAKQLGVELIARLGSVCDRMTVDEVLAESNVDIVLHAAAYKHVPLIETNEVVGTFNNVVGTQTVAEAAAAAEVERFILVSTDKAVRPTNVMGATKRLAELVVQDLQTRTPESKFAMVRFGNVLGSSGSVIPLFQKQIAEGGPITLTHDNISRYFMTIPEAARLVLLAGAYATGGDVFVLDMGKAVSIKELAKRMIELSGLTIKDDNNPNGQIEIEIVGLRPGEKMHEELLIGDNALPTPHEKILRAEEASVSQLEMARILKDLQKASETASANAIRGILEQYVEGFEAKPATTGSAPH